MPCLYDWRDQSAVKTFSGFVSGAEFIRSAEAIAADPRFDELRVVYNDFLGISGHSIDASAYARVAACRLGAMSTNANVRVAFIALGQNARDLLRAIQPSLHARPFDPVVLDSMAAAWGWFARQPPLDVPRQRR